MGRPPDFPKWGCPTLVAFFATGWAFARTTICVNAHQAGPVSKPGMSALHHVQLLSANETARHGRGPRHVRTRTGTSPALVWMRRRRIRGHARACPPAHRGAGARQALARDSNAQANHFAQAATGGSASILASALLRLSRLERSQTDREAALPPSESGKAWAGGAPGGVEMEQLSALRNGSRGHGGD